MSKNIFKAVQAEYEFMSRVEKSIAQIILSDPKTFITYSMSELSKITGVSQGSINNFSKKFSMGGFSALKLNIAENLAEYSEEPFTVIDQSQSIKAAMELKINESLVAFHNTLEINDEGTLKNTVDKILSAKKIEVYGVFQSGIVAKDFCYQLIQLGIPATYENDMLMCAVSASMLDETGLVIAISSSGRTKEIVEAVEMAKKNQVPVVCLTADRFSPLAKLADDTLLAASSGMSVSDRTDEILLTQHLVIDTLCAYIRSIIDVGGAKHYYKLRDILSLHRIAD